MRVWWLNLTGDGWLVASSRVKVNFEPTVTAHQAWPPQEIAAALFLLLSLGFMACLMFHTDWTVLLFFTQKVLLTFKCYGVSVLFWAPLFSHSGPTSIICSYGGALSLSAASRGSFSGSLPYCFSGRPSGLSIHVTSILPCSMDANFLRFTPFFFNKNKNKNKEEKGKDDLSS